MKINSLLLTDAYKINHPFQYPEGTTRVYSNLTPRKSRIDGVNHMVFFGLQYFMEEYLIKHFNENFFNLSRKEVMSSYMRRIQTALGDIASYDHIKALHDLGYLPIEIKALPEGSKVPMRVPCLTIVNTHPDFYWVTNFLETLMSSVLWQASTSATIANEYKKILTHYAQETGMPMEFVQWQGHDFSFRGMSSVESAILSGMGHLLSFTGTDTIPAIDAMEMYYGANADNELIGGSVPATEHSVMCSGSKDSEIETFRRLITKVHPKGIVSIVSDTWDLWKVLTEYLPALKDEIIARDGKVVIRPDSGDPADIICGQEMIQDRPFKDGNGHIMIVNPHEPSRKGVIELLWDVFGGTVNEKGYKVLAPCIGAIYGDSITPARAKDICERLKVKGFASQCVFGIGSYTYQYNTRDTFGIAMKATHVVINGEQINIFKSPVTDDGTKKSATGLLAVHKENGEFVLKEQCSAEEENGGELQTVFIAGKIVKKWTLAEIRKTLSEN